MRGTPESQLSPAATVFHESQPSYGEFRMGIGIQVEGLTKSFGSQRIWEDVTLELPPGEVSVLLCPSGTGKSVFLKSLIGLLRPPVMPAPQPIWSPRPNVPDTPGCTLICIESQSPTTQQAP